MRDIFSRLQINPALREIFRKSTQFLQNVRDRHLLVSEGGICKKNCRNVRLYILPHQPIVTNILAGMMDCGSNGISSTWHISNIQDLTLHFFLNRIGSRYPKILDYFGKFLASILLQSANSLYNLIICSLLWR